MEIGNPSIIIDELRTESQRLQRLLLEIRDGKDLKEARRISAYRKTAKLLAANDKELSRKRKILISSMQGRQDAWPTGKARA